MFDLSVTFFAVAIPAVLFSGISKSGFGSGAAFAAAPILALILPPAVAVALMLPLLMAVDLATLGPFWKRWDGVLARRLILGALPGIVMGMLIFRWASPEVLKFLIGCMALAFVGYQLSLARGLLKPRSNPFSAFWGVLFGAFAGLTSFISHAGGPPVAVYLLSHRPDKTTFQATTVLVFWAINLMKAVPYAALGIFTRETLFAGLLLLPVALIGARIGVYAHRRVPERAYFALMYVLLTLTGSKLIYDALI